MRGWTFLACEGVDGPCEGMDTIPSESKKFIFWLRERGRVSGLGYRGRTPLERGTCHGESWDIAPVSGTIPVSVIPFEEYLKIFLCVLEMDETRPTRPC